MGPITCESAIALLNEALQSDPEAINKLFAYHVKCNDRLTHHPTVQVDINDGVGLLGIINGIFGVDEASSGFICAMYDTESGKLIRFCLTSEVAQCPK